MINKVILVGRVGKDPEVKTLDNGTVVANFSLATNESYKDKNGNKVETAEWHNIALWKGVAEVAQKHLHKGDMIYIEGKIKTRSWEKDGEKRYTTEIHGDVMKFLGGGKGSSSNSESQNTDSTDDLPF